MATYENSLSPHFPYTTQLLYRKAHNNDCYSLRAFVVLVVVNHPEIKTDNISPLTGQPRNPLQSP